MVSSSGWTIIDTRRAVVFLMSILVGLSSGSNYVYSAYAPQLAGQLVLSSTQVIGLAGNLGMYLTGPLWGKMVDSRGQRLPLLIGSICCFSGYIIVRLFYNHILPIRQNPGDPASPLGLFIICFAMFLTGTGGSAGLSGSVNAAAKSFPDKTRASATGTVLAGFGLSAFAFSTVGHMVYGGDAGGLLLLLAIGTSLPMFIGSFIILPVYPTRDAEEEGYMAVGSDVPEIIIEDEDGGMRTSIESLRRYRSNSLELARSISPVHRGRSSDRNVHFSPSTISPSPPLKSHLLASLDPTYTPYDLFFSTEAYLLFVILALLCGTGLMYINNVGTVALALTRQGHYEYDKHAVSAWQAKQVATVSIWNCSGRILGGIFSDFCKTKFHMARIWFLPMVAMMFVASQITALETTAVNHLWMVSTCLGLAYGSLFNVLPMLTLEWFGMSHFSANYGSICLAPVIGGNIFNLVFGRVYDSNTIGRIGSPESVVPVEGMVSVVRSLLKRAGGGIPEGGSHDCLIGAACYAAAFKVSITGCLIAFVLSMYAGVRRARESRERGKLELEGGLGNVDQTR